MNNHADLSFVDGGSFCVLYIEKTIIGIADKSFISKASNDPIYFRHRNPPYPTHIYHLLTLEMPYFVYLSTIASIQAKVNTVKF